MKLSIIIVNWNSAKDVQRSIESIFSATRNLDFEIIVVDSGSFDGCGEMIATHFPQVRFIQSQENVGFGRANNLGAKAAQGDFLLFLNPDTEVIGNALTTLAAGLAGLSNPGCVGARLLNPDRSLQTSCIQTYPTIANQVLDADFLRRWFPKAKLWGMAPLFSGSSEPAPVEAISGACVMTRKAVFDQIGGFSPDYFMYAEDMDICYKAHLAGFANYYIPTAQIVHYGDSSVRKARSNFAVVMAIDSLTRYFRKFHGPGYAWLYKAIITEVAIVRLALLLPGRIKALFSRKKSPLRTSWDKWRAILRWGFGLERWTSTYKHSTL